jgi:hypothetical protein
MVEMAKSGFIRILLLLSCVGLGAILISCATSPGKQIGNLGCNCVKNSGGDKQKIRECVETFHKAMMEEMQRQKSVDAVKNNDADEAFQQLKRCMDELQLADTSQSLPPSLMPMPKKE